MCIIDHKQAQTIFFSMTSTAQWGSGIQPVNFLPEMYVCVYRHIHSIVTSKLLFVAVSKEMCLHGV